MKLFQVKYKTGKLVLSFLFHNYFHGLNPDNVVNHAYNTAIYIFNNNAPINLGETIAALKGGRMDIDIKCLNI